MTADRPGIAATAGLLDDAIGHHRAGRLEQAMAGYQRILRIAPRHPDALHLSGLGLQQSGQPEAALDRIRAAVAAQPHFPAAHNSLGTVLSALGRFGEAEAAYRTAIRQQPDYAEAHGNLGLLYQDAGRLDLAAPCFHEAVKANSGHAPAWRRLALALAGLRHPDAEACLRRALADDPVDADLNRELATLLAAQGRETVALEVLQTAVTAAPADPLLRFAAGSLLYGLGRLSDAAAQFRVATAAGADLPGAFNNLGVVLLDLDKHREAIAALRRSVALNPDDAVALNNLGTAFDGLRELDEAHAAYRRSLTLRPDYGKAWNNLGGIYKAWNRPDRAVELRRIAIATLPDYPDSYANLGAALQDLDRLPEAERAYRCGLRLNPDSAVAHTGLGLILHVLSRVDEAAAAHRRAIDLDRTYAEAHANLGMLHWQVRMDGPAAEESLDRALALDPTLGPAHLNRGLVRLARGAIAEGWEDYQWRFRAKGYEDRAIAVPVWTGFDLAGKRLMVWREQGVGDEILFASCYGDLQDRAGHLVIECDRRLVPLFQRSFPRATVRPQSVTADGRELIDPPDVDCHIPAGGVPRLLRTSLRSFPGQPWLTPDPALVNHWQDRLAALGPGLRVGIGWRSQMMTTERRAAYTTLDQWSALFAVPGIQFVLLQYGEVEAEVQAAERRYGVRIHRWADLDLKDDFEGAAALAANLDLVISPAMSAGELAGALGVPVWRFGGRDWTQLGSAVRPWFPTMRLFQPRPGETLENVLGRIAGELCRLRDIPRTRRAQSEAPTPDPDSQVAEAVARYRTGDPAEAERIARKVLGSVPDHPVALHLAGLLTLRRGEAEAAAELLTRAGRQDPGNAAAHAALADALRALGRFDAAEAALRNSAAAQPDSAGHWINRTALLRSLGREAAALAAVLRALTLRPDLGLGHTHLAQLTDDPDRSLACHRRALTLDPGRAEALSNLAGALFRLDRFTEAERAARWATLADPALAAGWSNLGNALDRLNRVGEAERSHRAAIDRQPGLADAHVNLAHLLQRAGRTEEAAAAYRQALEVDPRCALAHYNLSLLLLADGAIKPGWSGHEWRFSTPQFRGQGRSFAAKAWRGENVSRARVLVWREQGVGDEILLSSCYGDLQARAGHLVIECDRRLVGLFARSFPGTTVRPVTADPQDIDVQIAAGSLPRLLRPDLKRFPAKPGWLMPDPALVERWRDRLAALGPGLRLGIGWRSQLMTAERRAAYTTLNQWSALFAVPGIQFVLLQYGEVEAEVQAAERRFGVRIHRWADLDLKDDFESAAALAANLDLVISPAMSAGELAGALGVPVWRFGGRDWTQLGAAVRPWFPTMRLFQPRPGETLEDVLGRMAAVLRTLSAAPPPPPAVAEGADALLERAVEHHREGRLGEAAPLYETVLRLRPGDAVALHLSGLLAHQSGQSTDGAVRIAAALAAMPDYAAAHISLGTVRLALGEPAVAAAAFAAALTLRPADAAALTNLGNALEAAGRLEQAERAHRRAVRTSPSLAEAHDNLGAVLTRLGRVAEAEASHCHAQSLDPLAVAPRLNRAVALRRLGRLEEAEAASRAVLSLDPALADAMANLGRLLRERGRAGMAERWCDRALALEPGQPAATFNKSLLLLTRGALTEGWAGYDRRFEGREVAGAARKPGLPLWRGENLARRRILVSREQGIGDELMFACCLPDLIARAGHVVLECDRRFVPLFVRSFPSITVRAEPEAPDARVTDADVHIPLGSLPRRLRRTLGAFNSQGRFLTADPAVVAQWQRRLEALGPGLKVGVAWRSGLLTAERLPDYTRLSDWEPVLRLPGLVSVNLQYGDCAAELAECRQRFGVAPLAMEGLDLREDLDSTAALMSALDLVIAPATSTGELAAALGVPVWRLGRGGDWTALGTGVRPWFASMRIFRTGPGESVSDLPARVAQALRDFMK